MDTVTVRLSADEAATLHRVLRHYLSELRMEIAATDRKDFRDPLKDEEVFIKDLLTRLQTPPTLPHVAVQTPLQVAARE